MKAPLLASSINLFITLTPQFSSIHGFAYVDEPDGILSKVTRQTSLFPQVNQLTELATFANTLADAARLEILPYWRVPRHKLAQEIKRESDRSEFQSASPVTLADRAAERVMRDLIERTYPNHGIYGEEYGVIREDADFVWVLDPIDGTRSFITGKPLFGTLISCLYRGKPVIGIIDQCILDERWLGIAGQQSTLNEVLIQTDGAPSLKDAEMYSTSPEMFRDQDLIKFTAMKNAVRTPHYGADCYAYALLASGYCDVVVEADLGLYDYCALVPVLEGAGGWICDWEGRELSLQNHERSKGRVVACANKQLLSESLKILNQESNDLLNTVENKESNSLALAHQSPAGLVLFGFIVGEVITHIGNS